MGFNWLDDGGCETHFLQNSFLSRSELHVALAGRWHRNGLVFGHSQFAWGHLLNFFLHGGASAKVRLSQVVFKVSALLGGHVTGF